MKITKKQTGEFLVLNIEGKIDMSNYVSAEAEVVEIINAGNKNIIMNCQELEYVSSAGLRVFLTALKKVKALGGKIAVCHLNDDLQEAFEVSSFASIFKVFPDLEGALNS